MPWVRSLGEGLIAVHQALVPHQLVEETGIEEVQDGVLNTANVLIDRQPVAGALVQHGGIAVGRTVAGVVPGGLEEGIEGIRLPGLAAAQLGESRHLLEGRTRTIDDDILRQPHRQVGLGAHLAIRPMDHRQGAAPVALPGDAPIAQAEIDAPTAPAPLLQPGGDGGAGLGGVEPIEGPRVTQ
jgi:hypothetical protein